MILIVDNYDSFVYNLARYTGKLGRARTVLRNNDPALFSFDAESLEAIIISPGPCTPQKAGSTLEIIRRYGPRVPVLGVCLGHQAIAEVYGGATTRAPYPVHGKQMPISHDGRGLFMGLPNPMAVARYHSLCVYLPEGSLLDVTAECEEDGVIMALQHRYYPVYGIQFHPESILTAQGLDIMRNFFIMADQWHETLAVA